MTTFVTAIHDRRAGRRAEALKVKAELEQARANIDTLEARVDDLIARDSPRNPYQGP